MTGGAGFFESIGKCYAPIIVLFFTAICLSLGFIWCLSKFARCMAYTAIALLLLILLGGGAIMIVMGLSKGSDEYDKAKSTSVGSAASMTGNAVALSATGGTDKSSFIIVGVVMLLIGAIVLCTVWCYRKSLEVAIAVIDASADFLISTKRIILVSVMYFMVAVITAIIWVVCIITISGINKVS